MTTPGQTAWTVAFQKCPIILVDGIAQFMPGGMLPILAFTEAINFPLGLLSNSGPSGINSFFADFMPMPGMTVIDQDLGQYPFANQAIAANAVITSPTTVSVKMTAPAKSRFGYPVKLPIMTALIESLKQHNATGGLYIIATPSVIMTNCVMLTMLDVSGGETKQVQHDWMMNFRRPLLTLNQAIQAQNGLISKITAGLPIVGQPAYSGLPPTVGNPATLAGPAVVPSLTGATGAGAGSITVTQLAPLAS